MYPGEDGRPDPSTVEPFLREGRIYPGVDIEVGPEAISTTPTSSATKAHRAGRDPPHRLRPGSAPTARLTADPHLGPRRRCTVNSSSLERQSSDPNGDALDLRMGPRRRRRPSSARHDDRRRDLHQADRNLREAGRATKPDRSPCASKTTKASPASPGSRSIRATNRRSRTIDAPADALSMGRRRRDPPSTASATDGEGTRSTDR